MSRTLNDDFDEDDLPSKGLDLEKGGNVGTGVSAEYDGGGIDFDDELYGDGATGGALELDMPPPNRTGGKPSAPPSHLSHVSAPPRQSGGSGVPDLALPPAAQSSGKLPAARTSGAHAAASGPSNAPSSRPDLEVPPAPPSSDRDHHHHHEDDRTASGPSLPQPPFEPAKPTPAAMIARYPSPPTKILEAPKYAIRILLRQFELRSELESLRRRRSPDVPLYEAALRTYDTKTFRLGMALLGAALTVTTFIVFLPVIIRFMRAD